MLAKNVGGEKLTPKDWQLRDQTGEKREFIYTEVVGSIFSFSDDKEDPSVIRVTLFPPLGKISSLLIFPQTHTTPGRFLLLGKGWCRHSEAGGFIPMSLSLSSA